MLSTGWWRDCELDGFDFDFDFDLFLDLPLDLDLDVDFSMGISFVPVTDIASVWEFLLTAGGGNWDVLLFEEIESVGDIDGDDLDERRWFVTTSDTSFGSFVLLVDMLIEANKSFVNTD